MAGDDLAARFQQSLNRASAQPHFLDLFYDRFLGISNEIARVFQSTDMAQLKRKLQATLHLATLAVEQAPGVEMYLEHLGRLHDRLDIRPEFYDLWKEALIQTARACDPEFTQELEEVWRQMLARMLRAMRGSPDPSPPGG